MKTYEKVLKHSVSLSEVVAFPLEFVVFCENRCFSLGVCRKVGKA